MVCLADGGDCAGRRPVARRVSCGRRGRRRCRGGHGSDAEVDEGEVDALAGQCADAPRRVDVAAAGQLRDVVGQVA